MPASLTLPRDVPATPPRPAGIERRDIGGIGIAVLSRGAALAELSEAMKTGRHIKLAFCNANLVNIAADDPALLRSLSGFLVLTDGLGVDLGGWLLHGAPFPDNLNGTDFIPALLEAEPRSLSVGLLGARPGVAERAARTLAQRYPRHAFRAFGDGFFDAARETEILGDLAAAPPDLLLVAFGNPRQERWIAETLGPQHATIAAGVGALFDFLAGEVPRAPEAWRRARLEWLYRLRCEPARLWRRYILGNPLFLLRILRQRLRTVRPQP